MHDENEIENKNKKKVTTFECVDHQGQPIVSLLLPLP